MWPSPPFFFWSDLPLPFYFFDSPRIEPLSHCISSYGRHSLLVRNSGKELNGRRAINHKCEQRFFETVI